MAVGQPEVQYTDTYGFRSSCTSGSAPPRSSAALRRGTRRFRNRFNSPGMVVLDASQRFPMGLHDARRHTIQWNPARADVRYTPQLDGSLSGTMHTEILTARARAQLRCT
jgi:hypothetical protein